MTSFDATAVRQGKLYLPGINIDTGAELSSSNVIVSNTSTITVPPPLDNVLEVMFSFLYVDGGVAWDGNVTGSVETTPDGDSDEWVEVATTSAMTADGVELLFPEFLFPRFRYVFTSAGGTPAGSATCTFRPHIRRFHR